MALKFTLKLACNNNLGRSYEFPPSWRQKTYLTTLHTYLASYFEEFFTIVFQKQFKNFTKTCCVRILNKFFLHLHMVICITNQKLVFGVSLKIDILSSRRNNNANEYLMGDPFYWSFESSRLQCCRIKSKMKPISYMIIWR